MRIETDIKLDFDDVLICPKRSQLTTRDPNKGGPTLYREFTFKHSKLHYRGVPIMASNMDGVGTFSMARALKEFDMFTVLRKHYTYEDWKKEFDKDYEAAAGERLSRDHIAICTGTNAIHDDSAEDYATLKRVIDIYAPRYLCIDVANGYQENFADFVKRMRDEFPTTTIIAGNVVTYEMTEQLILSGADIVKVGIGPGSVCTTRTVTGVGYPQLSAIIECADAAHGLDGHVIADGGCREPGDVAKAFAAGADFVMLGGMLAAHDESEYKKGFTKYVPFYGMASDEAMLKHGTRKDGYRGPEGKKVLLEPRGPVKDTVENILGGVRSACTYVGARRLKDLSKRTTFVLVNQTHNRVFD